MVGNRSACNTRGSLTDSVFQPRWTSLPLNGAWPQIADQAEFIGGIPGRHADPRTLAFGADGSDGEMLVQGRFAALVDGPGGSADLSVAVGRDVVHQEIDQPALFLKYGEEGDHLGVGLVLRDGSWNRLPPPRPRRVWGLLGL